MKLSVRVKTILLGAAVAALPLFSTDAHAQYRVGEDGRLLDANNRIGSGGYNTGGIPYTALMQGNRIVTGNVTAGREFRGGTTSALINGLPVSTGVSSVYTDPLELRTGVAGENTDAFIRRSYGVTNGAAGQFPNQPQVFYGRALATPPPVGAVRQGFSGTYVAPGGVPPYAISSPFITSMSSQVTSPQITLPRPGELLLPGPLDPQTNRPTYLQASPLAGVRQLRGEDLDSGASPTWRQQLNGESLRLDNNVIRDMRNELRRAGGLAPLDNRVQDENLDPDRPRDPNALPDSGNLAQPLGRPIDTADTPSLTQKPLDNSLTAQPNPENVRPGMSNRLVIDVPPNRQSTQLAAMERNLEQYYNQRLQSDQQKNEAFLRQLHAKQEADNKLAQANQDANPGDPDARLGDVQRPNYREMSRRVLEMTRDDRTADVNVNANANANPAERRPTAMEESLKQLQNRGARGQGGAGATDPGAAGGGTSAPLIRPQPVQVASLAEGIKAEGLAKVMRQAEDLMKQGRFVSALDQYAVAEQVAENNPLVWLGQAHAELGAGYYLRAADHLRRALVAEPALMMAQYDLRGMIGQERLEALVKDLKETARAQEQNHGLVFLLSYLAYNTSNVQQAAIYLDLAQKRAGDTDEFYRLVRVHWNLPGGDAAVVESPRIPLSEVYKQFEAGNVTNATVTDDRITGEFREPVDVQGTTGSIRSFSADLPAGAAGGAFGQWVKDNSKGATVRFQTRTQTTPEPTK